VLTSFSGEGTTGGNFFNAAVALARRTAPLDLSSSMAVRTMAWQLEILTGRRNSFVGINSASEGFFVFLNTGPNSNCAAFSVTISFALCAPADPDTTSPVRFIASPNMPNGVDHIEVWDNGTKIRPDLWQPHLQILQLHQRSAHGGLVAGEQTRGYSKR